MAPAWLREYGFSSPNHPGPGGASSTFPPLVMVSRGQPAVEPRPLEYQAAPSGELHRGKSSAPRFRRGAAGDIVRALCASTNGGTKYGKLGYGVQPECAMHGVPGAVGDRRADVAFWKWHSDPSAAREKKVRCGVELDESQHFIPRQFSALQDTAAMAAQFEQQQEADLAKEEYWRKLPASTLHVHFDQYPHALELIGSFLKYMGTSKRKTVHGVTKLAAYLPLWPEKWHTSIVYPQLVQGKWTWFKYSVDMAQAKAERAAAEAASSQPEEEGGEHMEQREVDSAASSAPANETTPSSTIRGIPMG